MHATPTHTNRLIHETSPYLIDHAHNPVDWYPWGTEALEKAKAERKPILLSIGYAACHWCHVLAHESFEDEETARLMNELFVNIKVDREERPDIDRIYQIAQQVLTQRSGGWPLTMFLTPDDQKPFFGGTYFPPEPRHGLPGFKDLLQRVAEYYREHEPELRAQNAALMKVYGELNPPPAAADAPLTDTPIHACREQLASSFDRQFGGFGGAPKFPHPLMLEFLLRRWEASNKQLSAGSEDAKTGSGLAGNGGTKSPAHEEQEPDLQSLYMATLTLRRMGEGGINDQLGGGFCRYSVDPYWMIPHFEKMLYDNGSLLAVYAQATVATGDGFYARIAAETAQWAMREMQSPEGGFYSSLDADSEGHEGKFYVWDREEVRKALTADEYAAFAPRFGLDREPNFEGKWHLHAFKSIEQVAGEINRSSNEVEALIESARHKLLKIRSARVWLARDEKILTSWNALMIRGLAIAARALDRDDFAVAATRALDFIRSTLWRDGRLLATYKDGRAHLNAYLDDYVYLADAVLELQQLRFRSDELAFASELLDVVLTHFADSSLPSSTSASSAQELPTAGPAGFFFTSDDHETLIHRSKSFSDDATPAGNGIAAFVMQRMGYLLGETRYLKAAEGTLRAAWQALEKYPQGHASLLIALDELLHPPQIVILRGERTEIDRWRSELAKLYAPRRLVLAISADAADLPNALAEKSARATAVAYICRGSSCSPPVKSLEQLAQALAN